MKDHGNVVMSVSIFDLSPILKVTASINLFSLFISIMSINLDPAQNLFSGATGFIYGPGSPLPSVGE